MTLDFGVNISAICQGPVPGTAAILAGGDIVILSSDETLEVSHLPRPSGAALTFLETSPTQHAIIAMDASGELYIWKAAFGWEHATSSSVPIISADLVSDTMILGAASGEILVLGPGRRFASSALAHGDQVMAVRALTDNTFISGSRDGTVAKWTLHEGNIVEVWRTHLKGKHFVNRVDVRSDQIAVGTASGSIAQINTTTGAVLFERKVHSDSIRTLTYNSDGHWLLSSGDDSAVIVSPAETLEPSTVLSSPTPYIRAAAITSDSSRGVVLGDTRGAISLISSSGQIAHVPVQGAAIRSIHITADSRILAGREDGTVDCIDLAGYKLNWRCTTSDSIFSLTQAADGTVFAGSRSGLLFTIQNGTVTAETQRHASVVGGLTLSGRVLISCSDDRSLRATHVSASTKIFDLVHSGLALNNILTHSNGRLYVTSDDGTILEYTPGGQLKRTISLHVAPVRAISEIRDGLIVSGDRSGVVQIWSPDADDNVLSISLSRRVVELGDGRPHSDCVIVTENEVSLLTIDRQAPRRNSDASYNKTESDRPQPAAKTTQGDESVGHILHLSDLHFHGAEDVHAWVSPLVEDLRRELAIDRLDLVVLSGDVTNSASPKEFRRAAEFVKLLKDEMGAPALLVVPGNHDLSWAVSRSAYQPMRRSDITADVPSNAIFLASKDYAEVADAPRLRQRFAEFSKFHRSVTTVEYPLDPSLQYTSVLLSPHGVGVYGLNSSWQIDHNYRSRASISPSALSRLLSFLRHRPDHEGAWLRVAVWHHPVSEQDAAISNPETLDQLAKAGFRILLHGHIHRPSLRQYDLDIGGPRRVVSIGAGTFGSLTHEWTPGFPLGYNCLSIFKDRIVVSSRRREFPDGPWLPDARWGRGAGRDPSSSFTIWRDAAGRGEGDNVE
jgi:WD40 repeat protein/predicted MPP superfamily phosphohydrolase